MFHARIVFTCLLCSQASNLKDSVGCSQPRPSWFQTRVFTDQLTLQVDDPLNAAGVRSYMLFVPSSYNHAQSLPLVFDFHGFYDDSMGEAKEDGLALVAEREGFIVVYPKGLADAPHGRQEMFYSWNGGGSNGSHGVFGPTCDLPRRLDNPYPCFRSCEAVGLCKSDPQRNQQFCDSSTCTNDVAFIEALFAYLTSNLCIDQSRVHGTAMSNGAIFLYYLATTSFGKHFASVVPVAGSLMLGHAAAPSVPIPIVDIHGVRDETVPANVSNSYGKYKQEGCPVDVVGRAGCTVSEDLFFYTPQDKLLALWARVNSCGSQDGPALGVSTSSRFDGVGGFTCTSPYGACKYMVVRCVHDAGHTWPFGVGLPGSSPSSLFGDLFWHFAADLRKDLSHGPADVAAVGRNEGQERGFGTYFSCWD